MSLFADSLSLGSLLNPSEPAESSEAFTYGERNLKWLPPQPGSLPHMVTFETERSTGDWIDWREAFLYLPIRITTDQAIVKTPDYPPMAFKTSAMSLFQRIRVEANGVAVLDEQNTFPWSSGVQLLFERDRDWLEAQGPEIHYSRDRPAKGVVGLKSLNEIDKPNISRYTDAPDVGVAADAKNYQNPAYNEGFHERCQYLFSAAHTDNGVAPTLAGAFSKQMDCVLRIPLRQMHDFLRQLDFPITGQRLSFTFTLNTQATGAFVPVTIGSALGVGATPNVAAFSGSASVSIPDTVYEGGKSITPRLYYHKITLRDRENQEANDRIIQGLHKSFQFRRYTLVKDANELRNQAVGNHTYQLPGLHHNVKKVFAFVYPTGKVNTASWPSTMVTGPYGLTNAFIDLNGNRIHERGQDTPSEQYDALKQAMRVGMDSNELESLLPFEQFRLTSRVLCFDVARARSRLANPNDPMTIGISADIVGPGPVDIVYLVEFVEKTDVLLSKTDSSWATSKVLI